MPSIQGGSTFSDPNGYAFEWEKSQGIATQGKSHVKYIFYHCFILCLLCFTLYISLDVFQHKHESSLEVLKMSGIFASTRYFMELFPTKKLLKS